MHTVNNYLLEVRRNREFWERKPLLRETYGKFYSIVASQLTGNGGITLELGAGIGHGKEFIPGCVTSDMISLPWLDRVEDAYHINYGDGELANLVLFDVWHHLEYPLGALGEFARVVRRGGRVVLMDPACGLLGLVIWGIFHQEPVGMFQPIRMDTRAPEGAASAVPHAMSAKCWRMFRGMRMGAEIGEWKLVERKYFSSLAYLGSGGYSGPQVLPHSLAPLAYQCEKICDRFPALFALRMMVVLERN